MTDAIHSITRAHKTLQWKIEILMSIGRSSQLFVELSRPERHPNNTYIVMKCFCFWWMFTLFSSLGRCTIQIPKHTANPNAKVKLLETVAVIAWPCACIRKTKCSCVFVCVCVCFVQLQQTQYNTYHHQECRNPGGSPSVIFFSHRISDRNVCAAFCAPICNRYSYT